MRPKRDSKQEALIAAVKLLLLPINDLPLALRSIVWSFRGAPAITKSEQNRLVERLDVVAKGLGARPTPETFYRELGILDAKAAALQQINAIGVAIVVFLPTQHHSLPFRVATFAALVLLAWSVVTIAPLNLISWGRRRPRHSSESENASGASTAVAGEGPALAGDDTRLLRLLRLSDLRSNLLRRATVRSILAFLMLATLVGVAVLGGEYL
jgi:hypothetical protein